MRRAASLLRKSIGSTSFASRNHRGHNLGSQFARFSQQNHPQKAKFGKYFVFAGSLFCISVAATWLYDRDGEKHSSLGDPSEAGLLVHADEKKKLNPWMDNTVFSDGDVPIYRIVLTGGPCGGKSTAMTQLSERLKALGFQVFIVTEIATMMMTSGALFRPDMSITELLAFESSLLQIQMAVEDGFVNLAKASGRPTILLCDRGAMDPKAYLDEEKFNVLLDMNGWNVGKLRDNRYDCVIHLVTAAIGAEKFYTLENNKARRESLEEARALDRHLREAYIGHPNLFIVDNSSNFEGKIQRVLNIVHHVIGLPKPINYRRRFLLNAHVPNQAINVPFEETEIEQTFLEVVDPKQQRRVRKAKSKDGAYTYIYSTKAFSDDSTEASIVFRPISGKNYYVLHDQQDKNFKPVKKYVRSFVYQDFYFELATYLVNSTSVADPKNPTVLSVEALPNQKIEFPQFLEKLIAKDVTTLSNYSSYSFAKQK